MAGYLPEEATADAFADGWYRTGDVGWLEPEGWVHLTDRSKEMIKVNGFQVAPAEIEAVLRGHPAVLDCAVFGSADERAGEVPVAAVQLDPDRPVGDDELQELVAGSLATYKRLRHVVVVDDDPAPARRERCCGARSATNGRRSLAGAARRRPDGRPALPGAAGAARLRRPRSSTASAPARSADSTIPSGWRKLDAAVAASGWRELRDRRGRRGAAGVGGRGRPWSPRSWAGGWPTRRSSDRRWPPSCGGWPARRRATPPRPSRSCTGSSSLARCCRRRRARRAVAVDAQRGAARGAAPRARRRVATVGRTVELPPRRSGLDLTRPSVARRPVVRRQRWSSGRGPISHGGRPGSLDRARPRARLCRPGRDHARRRGPGRRLRPSAGSSAGPSARSRPSSTCWPTRSSLMEGSRSMARARRLGGRRARPRPTPWPPPPWPRPTAPGPRAHGVRDRHPGARGHRQHLGVPGPRLPAAGAAVDRHARRRRARASSGWSPTTGSEVGHGLR